MSVTKMLPEKSPVALNRVDTWADSQRDLKASEVQALTEPKAALLSFSAKLRRLIRSRWLTRQHAQYSAGGF